MRIAFVGKGGSGKTTVSSLTTAFLTQNNKKTILIDADINQQAGLGILEITQPAKSLFEKSKDLKNYYRGSNSLISSVDEFIKTTPPGMGSNLLTFNQLSEVLGEAVSLNGKLLFCRAGDYASDDIGIACYHGKVGGVEMLLNHLYDQDDEYILVDMTAGADSFSSGLFLKFDLTVLVVEPTLKSLGVYEQYLKLAQEFPVSIAVVGNKINIKEDEDFIKSRITSDYLGSFYIDQEVARSERGEKFDFSLLDSRNLNTINNIISKVNAQARDWEVYHKHSIAFHLGNCKSWANSKYGKDLTLQIDPEFRYR